MAISGTGWSLGNATVEAAYKEIGKTVHFRLRITWGSTSTFGGSPLVINLPRQAAHVWAAHYGWCIDASTSARYVLQGYAAGGSTVSQLTTVTSPTTNLVTNNPFAWAAGDHLVLQGTYEAA